MMPTNQPDWLAELSRLRPIEPSREGAGRIRAHAHLILERRRKLHATRRLLINIALNGAVIVVSGVYLVGAVTQAVRLFAGLR